MYGMSFIGRLIILFIGTDDQHILSYNPIFIFGLTLAAVCERLKLPRILGMLATGIILAPLGAFGMDMTYKKFLEKEE